MKLLELLGVYFGILFLFYSGTEGLRCYVCNDCGESDYNENQLIECDKEEKCIKTVEAGTEIVSRACGIKELCTKSVPTTAPPTKTKRKSSDKIVKPNHQLRQKRFLLSPETTTRKPTGPPPPQITSLHCCDEEDGCNGSSTANQPLQFVILVPLLIISMLRIGFN